jgi:hypothetical protein
MPTQPSHQAYIHKQMFVLVLVISHVSTRMDVDVLTTGDYDGLASSWDKILRP